MLFSNNNISINTMILLSIKEAIIEYLHKIGLESWQGENILQMLEYRSTEVNHPEKKLGLDLPTILQY